MRTEAKKSVLHSAPHSTACSTLHTAPCSGKRVGTAVAEVALTMPVLVLVALATIDTCQVLYLKQSAKIAAYEGARTCLIAGVTAEDIQAECGQFLTSRGIEGFEIHLPESLQAGYGELLTVGVSVPADQNSLVTSWFYQGWIFTEQAVVMVEL